MRKFAILLVVVGIFGLAFSGCSSDSDAPEAPEAPDKPGAMPDAPDVPAKVDADAGCLCEQGKEGGTIWCPKCDVGYVKGDKTECKNCFAAAGTGGGKCEACAKKG